MDNGKGLLLKHVLCIWGPLNVLESPSTHKMIPDVKWKLHTGYAEVLHILDKPLMENRLQPYSAPVVGDANMLTTLRETGSFKY